MEFGIFFIVIIVVIIFRFIAGSFDGDRIENEIEANGGKVISKEWSPFGKGWLGEKDNRIYKVKYKDKHNDTREAYVKTSMMSGVYFTDDKIVESASSNDLYSDSRFGNIKNNVSDKNEDLKSENERLKREIEQLKKNRR